MLGKAQLAWLTTSDAHFLVQALEGMRSYVDDSFDHA
jgi:hypothetical protein